jgi:uncharacterized integral membrane protein
MAAMERDGPQGPRKDAPQRDRPREGPPQGEPTRPRDAGRQPEPQQERKPSSWEAADRKRRTALVVRLALGIILLTLFVIFVSLNSDEVPVHFIFTETQTPLAWVFLVCALVGGLVSYLLGRQGRRSARKYIKELERRLEERGGKR